MRDGRACAGKKERGNVFPPRAPREGQLTWRQRIGQHLVDLGVRHVLISDLGVSLIPSRRWWEGVRKLSEGEGGDEEERGAMMSGRAELAQFSSSEVGRYFPRPNLSGRRGVASQVSCEKKKESGKIEGKKIKLQKENDNNGGVCQPKAPEVPEAQNLGGEMCR